MRAELAIVTSLDTLHRAVAEFAVTDPGRQGAP